MKDKELVSNCCGARVDSLNAGHNIDWIGICSECKEGCGAEENGYHLEEWEREEEEKEVEEIPGFEGTLEQLDSLVDGVAEEGTFTKEELEILSWVMSAVTQEGSCDKGYYPLLRKISKLLKEVENE